ncbi:MAG: hypothetical protein ACJZ5B_05230 [Candidatus Poseidoniaceae archaeon]|nr:hypothetical protein [Euryarchaeota archaeon]RAH07995.1 MAG: hypothetical protein CBC92_000550 [Euryarchaeota archaeon TMED132]|tara:strand:+ start:7688 stop:8281 length:594 start_codon:yes stop_codon:yes gene_type:complete
MIGQDDIIFSEEGDMLVHEDAIQSSALSQEELAILEASKDAARIVQGLKREVTPNRVALAGVILLLLLGAIFSSWYWVIPRDSVTVETLYIQRGGHIVMSEIHNTGSREITDVSMDVKFQSLDGEVIQIMSIEVESISSHSSVAGDDLEMQILGHTVWDSYVIAIELQWTDYEGDSNRIIQTHEVGEWAWEEFIDKD